MTLKQKIAYREAMREMAEESNNLFNPYLDEYNRITKEIKDQYHWRIVKNAERLFRRNKRGIN